METEIGRRMRRIRQEKGLSAQEVARKAGISRSFYTLLEGGRRRLSVAHIEKIASALGVPLAQLLVDIPLSRPQNAASPGAPTSIRPINTPELRASLKLLLGDQTEDFLDCFLLYAQAPHGLKRALRAFHEKDPGTGEG